MDIMKRHLNLLPWKLRCRMLLRQRLRQWALAWTLFALLAAGLYCRDWYGLAQSQQDLEVWQRRAVTIQTINEKNESLIRQNAALRERLGKYGHLESEQIGFQLLAVVSQCSSVTSGSIQIQKLAFKQMQVAEAVVPTTAAPTTVPPAPKMRDVRTLALNGVASNNLAVAQFVAALRDSGAFHTVDLKSSQGNNVTAVGARNYQLVCSF